ncbi:MAG: DNA-processing protein DprA [Clostridia bacterium]|nr:DNA-processing protein DprA [Clostridia bacterium]
MGKENRPQIPKNHIGGIFTTNKKIYEIHNSDNVYPVLLKDIATPPKKLYAMGNINLLNQNSIAVIGSRHSSEYGRNITKKITKELVENNMVIVSGMANGIDSIAHETCLKNGGKTIAVLGSGFNYIYPKENEKLFYNIIENDGLVLSELPVDSPVQMKNFPKRNRIISGLSLGVLVIEAAYRSGTSITAKFAKAQGRKVFCIPNSIGNKNSYGTIELIKKGASLVRNAKDIFKDLELALNTDNNIEKRKKINKQLKILDEKSQKIFNCIYNNEGIGAEEISIKTSINIITVNQMLTYLEIDEFIINTGMNKFKVSEEYYE